MCDELYRTFGDGSSLSRHSVSRKLIGSIRDRKTCPLKKCSFACLLHQRGLTCTAMGTSTMHDGDLLM